MHFRVSFGSDKVLHFVINNLCSINLGRHAEFILSLCPVMYLLESNVLNWYRFSNTIGGRKQNSEDQGDSFVGRVLTYLQVEFNHPEPKGQGLGSYL